MFRSAAWAYGPRTVGVVLTGLLDDGTAGLWAIKTCGGVAVVQDPNEALFPDMPQNALRNVEVDHCLPLAKIPALLMELAHTPVAATRAIHVPQSVKSETEFAMMEGDMSDMAKLGAPSVFTCPSCRGALWEMHEGNLLRYRCHTGHALSQESLFAEQSEAVENALYSAIRALEEKAATSRRMLDFYGDRFPGQTERLQSQLLESESAADTIRHMLMDERPQETKEASRNGPQR